MTVDLKKINLPAPLIDSIFGPLPEEVRTSILPIKEELMNTKVLFVCGIESTVKDLLLGKLALAHAQRGKIVRFYTPMEMEDLAFQLSAFVNVIHSVDQLSKRASESLRIQMMDRALKGCKLIIGCHSVKTFSDKYGEALTSYLSPMSMSITVNQKRELIRNYEL